MKVEELRMHLSDVPNGTEVCIFDYRKNLHNASDEPQSDGVHNKFSVEFIKEGVPPFIALAFKNDDYLPDGMPDGGSSIYQSILNENK
jgi:hypothetical protein